MTEKLQYLKKDFIQEFEEISKYSELDKDFERICHDYETAAEMLKYLEDLLYPPANEIQKQITHYKELLSELSTEIKEFVNKMTEST